LIGNTTISAPDDLRDTVRNLTRMKQIRTVAAWRPDMTGYGEMDTAYRIALKSLARRFLKLHDEIADPDVVREYSNTSPAASLKAYPNLKQYAVSNGTSPAREFSIIQNRNRTINQSKQRLDKQKGDRGGQYLSMRYTERLAEAGSESSVSSIGDAYGNALAGTINGHYKTELVHRQQPWRNMQDLALANLCWVDWFNNRRPLDPTETSRQQRLNRTSMDSTPCSICRY